MRRKTVWILVFSLTFLIGVSLAAIKFYELRFEIPQEQIEIVTVESVSEISDEQISSERLKVYSTVIREKYLTHKPEQLVFGKETSGCRPLVDDEKLNKLIEGMEQSAKSRFQKIETETWENYKEANKKCVVFDKNFDVSVKQNFISEEETEKIFGTDNVIDGWRSFYKNFPKSSGKINFSNVGFNAQLTQAIVYVSHGCGGLCGSGDYYLLEKKNGKWEIAEEAGAWVS